MPDIFSKERERVMGTGDPFPGDKARPERDANYSLTPYSAEVKNEWEIYLRPPAPL
jgi:hypothetical protein